MKKFLIIGVSGIVAGGVAAALAKTVLGAAVIGLTAGAAAVILIAITSGGRKV